MAFIFVSIALVACLVCVAVACGVLWVKNKTLHRKLESNKLDLARTSKILIEKNLELVDQNVEQQKLLESKDDFINIVSHQLRTPITEIKWNLDTIRKDASWKITSEQRDMLETLYESVGHGIRLIDDIVHLVSVEQGAVHLAVVPYNPEEVVQQAAAKTLKSFSDKHIDLVVDTQCTSCTIDSIDPESLTMLVSNLIDNAFYYTPERGRVEVHTSATKGAYQVVVTDTGMGIPPEQQKMVFTKFKRSADAIQVNSRGSGLGLYIVKKIIEHHKGTISFVSTEGVGTTFTLTLPQLNQVIM